METAATTKISTPADYLALQPPKTRAALKALRVIIKKAAPEAEEKISYSMVGYSFHGMIAWYAGWEKHCGLYLRPRVMEHFKEKIAGYRTSKSTLQFPLGKPLPEKLIYNMIQFAAQENLKAKELKKRK